ncbi:MAG: cobalt ECF transporter T component CbiQ [Bryobacterales bacterium]|nr:cobalt ECF transporter T component CbiQ [Bryobacterales bacterium]
MSDIPLHHWLSRRKGFLERTLADLALVMDRSLEADVSSGSAGLLQPLDARVKLAAAGVLSVTAASVQDLRIITAVFLAATALAAASRVPLVPLSRVWLSAGVFSGVLALPALFLTPGHAVYTLPALQWHITGAGIAVASKLLARALATSTVGTLLVFTTPWNLVLKAMRWFRVPLVAVVLIGTTYRYIFLFLETAIDMMQSKKSRIVGRLPLAEKRRLAAAGIGVLLSKAFDLAGEVHLAMQARGYRGEVRVFDDFRMRGRDWIALGALVALEAGVWTVIR